MILNTLTSSFEEIRLDQKNELLELDVQICDYGEDESDVYYETCVTVDARQLYEELKKHFEEENV